MWQTCTYIQTDNRNASQKDIQTLNRQTEVRHRKTERYIYRNKDKGSIYIYTVQTNKQTQTDRLYKHKKTHIERHRKDKNDVISYDFLIVWNTTLLSL